MKCVKTAEEREKINCIDCMECKQGNNGEEIPAEENEDGREER